MPDDHDHERRGMWETLASMPMPSDAVRSHRIRDGMAGSVKRGECDDIDANHEITHSLLVLLAEPEHEIVNLTGLPLKPF
jgi:hypothetical protein